MNPYDEPITRTRRTRRMLITVPLHVPVPSDQPALPFEPPQPATGELTIEARFEQFHRENPHVYQALLILALTEVAQGARVVRTKHLFEQLRSQGCATVNAPGEEYRLNNIYTRCYARLLDRIHSSPAAFPCGPSSRSKAIMQTSRSRLETSISLGLILFGVLIASSSDNLFVTAFGVALLALGGALYFWGS